MHTLSPRRVAVLKVITDEHIVTALPVGSGAVSQSLGVKTSPATVRYEMAALEEEGFITRPHLSAGGIPADKGYRLYVEELTEPVELPPWEQQAMRRRFEWAERDVEAWTRLAAQMLSELVRNLAVVTFPRATEPRIRRLELVYLHELLVLLILVFEEARVIKGLLPLKEPMAPAALTQVANRLSDQFGGLSQREIMGKQVQTTPLEEQVLESTVNMMRQEKQAAGDDYLAEGLRHLLAQPEFGTSPRAQEVVGVLEEGRLGVALRLGRPEQGDLRITIGEENQDGTLKPLSMVVAPYGVAGGMEGMLGIVGPTRMAYTRTIAGVRYLSTLMSELVEGLYGGPSQG
jgi:heat-inducible transcriptional repressor